MASTAIYCAPVRGHSSAGRALAWHARGRRFDPGWLHHGFFPSPSPSSRGLGHHPFTVGTGVRIPVGTPVMYVLYPGGFCRAALAKSAISYGGRRVCADTAPRKSHESPYKKGRLRGLSCVLTRTRGLLQSVPGVGVVPPPPVPGVPSVGTGSSSPVIASTVRPITRPVATNMPV